MNRLPLIKNVFAVALFFFGVHAGAKNNQCRALFFATQPTGTVQVEVFDGSQATYRQMAEAVPVLRELENPALKEGLSKWADDAVAHIMVGEYHDGLLTGGMHSEMGLQVFLEMGGEVVREHQLRGGARIFELTHASLSNRAAEKASRAAESLGYDYPIKSVFPADWSAEKIVNAVNHVMKRADWSLHNNSIVGEYDGVTLKVTYRDGLIRTAYPFDRR